MIGVVSLFFGVVLMVLWNMREPIFFCGETLPLERAHMVPDSSDEIGTYKDVADKAEENLSTIQKG